MVFSPDAAFSYLKRAHEQGRLAHAYLISGGPGAGKRQLVSRIANLVNGTTGADVFATGPPDVFIAEPASKSRRIIVDQIRNLEHALQMRATGGRRKAVIVVDADRLQPQAANAFLKTLEEPPNDSLLLLLSTMPEALMDTIISRCIPLPLSARRCWSDRRRTRRGAALKRNCERAVRCCAGGISPRARFSTCARESAR